jgi:UDP-N-acetylmuramoyl-L-alanyl-D-glutamate--2,6-diaminopimelate ligase
MAGKMADLVIVTNEDPYDDDPQMIIDNVAQGALEAGKELNKTLLKYLDRRKAIKKALSEAKENDFVLITGKGAEQFICVANEKKIPWDDRVVVKEELQNLNLSTK